MNNKDDATYSTLNETIEDEDSGPAQNTTSAASVCTIASSVSTLAVSEDGNNGFGTAEPNSCGAEQDQCPRKKKRLSGNPNKTVSKTTNSFIASSTVRYPPIAHCWTPPDVECTQSGCLPLAIHTAPVQNNSSVNRLNTEDENKTEVDSITEADEVRHNLKCSDDRCWKPVLQPTVAALPVRPFMMERGDYACERESCFRVEAVASKMLGASPVHFHFLSDKQLASQHHRPIDTELHMSTAISHLSETVGDKNLSKTVPVEMNMPMKRRRCRRMNKGDKNEMWPLNLEIGLPSFNHDDSGGDEDSSSSGSSSSCNFDDSTSQRQKWSHLKKSHKEPQSLKGTGEGNTNISDLPDSILINIFLWLPLAIRLGVLSQVCKKWQELLGDPSLWRQLDLRGLPRLKDSTLVQLTSLSDRVYSLDMSDGKSTLVTDVGIQKVLKQCPFLKTVKMSRSFYLSDESFASLGMHCKNLTSISLDGCFTLTDTALKEISRGCPFLQELNISQCSKVSDEGVCAVATGCPDLKRFRLDQCVKVTDVGIIALAEHCASLEYLHMLSCSLTDAGIIHLKKLQKLQVLDLSNVTQLSPRCLETVAVNCPRLETLCVSLNRAVDDKCMRAIALGCPLLRCLSCVACGLTDTGLQYLGKYARNLERLDVAWCGDITDAGIIAISEAGSSLRYLGFMRCGQVTMETIEGLLEQFPHIQYSNFVLESRKLLERAEQAGFLCQSDDE